MRGMFHCHHAITIGGVVCKPDLVVVIKEKRSSVKN